MKHLGEVKSAIGFLMYFNLTAIVGLFWYEIKSSTKATALIAAANINSLIYARKQL